MTAEPTANSFRFAVLSGRAGRHDDLVVRTKRGRVDSAAEGLTGVPVSRAEERRGNQRGGDRHRLGDEQAILRHDGREHEVELINLSGGGAMVRGKLELMLWDRVGLMLGEGGELECAVRWIKDDQVGLEFAHETQIHCDDEGRDALLRAVIQKSFPGVEIEPLSPFDEEADEAVEVEKLRSSTRHPLIWNGVVYHDYEVEPVRIRNISVTGAQVQASHELPKGVTVFLDLGPAGKLEAVVRWTKGGLSGLAFAKLFDIHQLAKARPEVASKLAESEAAFGKQEPWAPGWKRSTIDEMAQSLGG